MKLNFNTTSAISCIFILLLFSAKVNAQYCIPAPEEGCIFGDYPSQFALTGTTISINDPSLTCSASGSSIFGGYQDLTATDTCAVSSPGTYSGTITGSTISSSSSGGFSSSSSSGGGGSIENMQIYVDFDNDGVFEASEIVGGINPVSSFSSTPFSITIPSGIATGFYRMRLVFTSTTNATYPAIDPCLEGSFFGFPEPYTSGEGIDYTLEVGTSTSTCGVPTGLAATGVTSTGAVLNWAEPSGTEGSEYVVTTTSGTPPGSGTPTTLLSYTATGLTPSTVYYASVRDSCGPGDFSAWVTITFTTTATSSCDLPVGLSASSITSTSAVLNWAELSGSVGSEYVVTTTAGTPPGAGTQTTLSTYTATGLTPSTVYYASVRDSCGTGGDLSAWVTITFTTTATSTGVSNVAPGDFSITTFPNPVKDMLTVSIKGVISGTAQIQLMDISGKLIKNVVVNANTLNISMSDMPSGVYLMRYIDAMHTETIKITTTQ